VRTTYICVREHNFYTDKKADANSVLNSGCSGPKHSKVGIFLTAVVLGGRDHCIKRNQGSIYWKISPPQGDYQPMLFWGKNMKRRREKGGKCERKLKTGERKKENEKYLKG
jgi:hypothetical protein